MQGVDGLVLINCAARIALLGAGCHKHLTA